MDKNLLQNLKIDYLLVNSTNEFLVEYSALSENARYTLTGFSGSTGDALVTPDKIYLFVDGRYHTQADNEVKEGGTVVKLQLGQKQDEEIRKLIDTNKTLGIVSKKVSQARLESFKGVKVKLLDIDPINNFTEPHQEPVQAVEPIIFTPQKAMYITNLEEVSYLTGLRDFSKDCSSKAYAKLLIKGEERVLNPDITTYEDEIVVDKKSISAYDYALIKNPIHMDSPIKAMKAIKGVNEINQYKRDFERTDKAVMAIREYIESNDNLSEYDISKRLREEFIKYGAKSLSFNSIVAINQNSALAHYSKNSKDVRLHEGDLVLIDCGAYYESGLATDITRVFVKGNPSELQRRVYTTVLKAFLNAFNLESPHPLTTTFKEQGADTTVSKDTNVRSTSLKGGGNSLTGFEYDAIAHSILDNSIEGFTFSHGLGHGIGINVHEAPPALNQSEIAHTEIQDGMTFTIEPGLYNPEYFGVRLENSCYKADGKIHSFVKMGYEGKLIDYSLLSEQETEWLKEFKIL